MGTDNKKKTERNTEIYESYLNGMGITEIGKEYQISKQRVSQIISRYKTQGYGSGIIKEIIYPNIRQWMIEKEITFNQFYGLFVVDYKSHVSYTTLSNFLRGKSKGNLELINRILEITGLTFESAFVKEKKRKSKKQIGSAKQCL